MNDEAKIIERLGGPFPVLPTPLHDDQSLDLDGLGAVIDRVLACGIRGLTLLGSSAEATYLSSEERARVLQHAIARVNGRATLIAGVIQYGTREAVEEGKRFRDLGADALMVALPQYFATPLATIVTHYAAIRRATEIPVLYYHFPMTTHLNLTPEQVASLFAEVDLCGIKNSSLDTQNTLAQIALIARPIRMFTGHSFDFLKVLDGGGAGSICPLAALMPRTALALHAAHARADRSAAEAAQKHFFDGLGILLPERTATGEAWGTPHGGVKAALAALGIIRSARMRDPQPMPSDAKRREIADLAAKVSEL